MRPRSPLVSRSLLAVAALGFASLLHAQSVSIVHNFASSAGAGPAYQSLIQASDGNFYGTTTSGGGPDDDGVAFRLTPAGAYTVLHVFSESTADGKLPLGGVVQGSDGNLYGMTQAGGDSGNGTIYKLALDGTFTLLHSFEAGVADGASPFGALVQGTDGVFYGTAAGAGANFGGIIFSITADGTYNVLYSLNPSTDGSRPFGTLVQGTDGNLYGMASLQGPAVVGTVFQVTTAGAFTVLHAFGGGSSDGSAPLGSLVQGADGSFYGMTQSGGPDDSGTIFSITSTGAFTLLHTFANSLSDGQLPYGSLVLGSDGTFYGNTAQGGSAGLGAAFSITSAGTYALLHSFVGGTLDGSYSFGSLVQGNDGGFYGATSQGGAAGDGVVFRLVPATPGAGPVQVSASATHVEVGGSFTLTYSVANAFSATLQRCVATNNAGDASVWTGIKTGSGTPASVVLTPPSASGSYTYALTCGGVETGFVTVDVLTTPVISSVTPNTGSAAGGTTVTLSGSGFSGASAVSFGGTAATSFTVNSDTSLTAVAPAGTAGATVDITVANATHSSSTSAADHFRYLVPQTITFTPPATPVFTGATATLAASGGASGNPVTFSIVSGPAMLSGTNNAVITYTGPGTVTIAANQAGDGTYADAPTVTATVDVRNQQTFVVNAEGSVSAFNNNGSAAAVAVSGGGKDAAVDATGAAWSLFSNGAGVSLFADTGAATTSYTASGLSAGSALAIDGLSRTWIVQGGTQNNLFEFIPGGAVGPGSGAAATAGISTPAAIAVDTAGSLWIANSGSNTLTEVIGQAAPVQTPALQQVITATPAQRP